MAPPHSTNDPREDDPLLEDDTPSPAIAVDIDDSPPCGEGGINKQIDVKVDKEVKLEFGGAVGVTFMMIFFPTIMYYFWLCLEFNNGALAHPDSISDIGAWLGRMWKLLRDHATPNLFAVSTYVLFCALQAFLAYTMPGPVVKGLPVPSLGFKQLEYLCNGVASWYVTLITSAILHFTGIFPLSRIIDNFGPIMTVSIIAGFAVTIGTYAYGVWSKNTHRMSGHFMYDLFMGAVLNPRIGKLDLKIWTEIRIPWVILFYLSVSAALKEYETTGHVRPELWFLVLAHGLYVNACMKGEECIPTTWDIFYEK
ncbi:hypothetical protein SpCBS45565_g01588 [Spizellomyces sp. 'palustris']|nr:hypothetical protein SpCBS45565_g01588 [Spizellomyces sp. 'palustris']